MTCCTTGIMGLLCAHKCDIPRVFASLAFQPPPPSYTVRDGRMEIILEEPWEEVQMLKQLVGDVEFIEVPTPGDPSRGMTSVFVLRRRGARRTILFSHANGADCGLCLPHMDFLRTQLDATVVFYEYRGYAGQSRRPNILAMERNATAAYHHALKLTTGGWRSLVVYGQSLGSHPTCFLAARFPVAGVVVHSGVASGMQVVFGPRVCCSLPSFLCACDSLRNEDTVRRIAAPVCVVHGMRDDVVAAWHGQRIHDRAPRVPECGPLWLDNAGHNDTMMLYYEEIAAHLRLFMAEIAPTAGALPAKGNQGAANAEAGDGIGGGGGAGGGANGAEAAPEGATLEMRRHESAL